jgi:hypothetical protein
MLLTSKQKPCFLQSIKLPNFHIFHAKNLAITGETMQLLPSKKTEPRIEKPKLYAGALPKTSSPEPTSASSLVLLTMLALGLLGAISFMATSLMPKSASPATVKRTDTNSPAANLTTTTKATQTGASVRMENNEDGSTMRVFWAVPVSEAQFWFNNKPVKADCNGDTCTLPKPESSNQVYFHWLNSSNNQWYYFACNGDYRGEFEGVPYSVK